MKHPYSTPFTLRWLIPLLGLQLPLCAQAQIKTDGSVGPAAQTLVGPKYVIPQSLGQLAGSNLFHSFQTFNINTGESANFTTSTTGINNVISRVTGGSASNINGTLSLTAASSTPAFFFINPAGVTFGKGASVDVPGALHISTANSLKFANGEFHADLQKGSTLSSAAPEAFGFLGTTRAKLVIKDGTFLLSTQAKQTISLTAGDIEINNANVISIGGGDIRVAALGAEAQIVELSADASTALGKLQISNNAEIGTLNNGDLKGGNVRIQAGNITLENGATIAVDTDSSGTGGSVTVHANGDITVDGGSGGMSRIGSVSDGSGHGGTVQVSASGTITLRHGGQIDTEALKTGDGGSLRVNATNMTIEGTRSFLTAYTYSSGKAGDIALSLTGNLLLRDEGGIFSPSYDTGIGGAIAVHAGNITLRNGGHIEASGLGSGDAGTIRIEADRMHLIGADMPTWIGASANGSSGNAGGLVLSIANGMTLTNGAIISSMTAGSGHGGTVQIRAGTLTLDGMDNRYRTTVSSFANQGSSGPAGEIMIDAQQLAVLNGADISSYTASTGQAGAITVRTDRLWIDGSFTSPTSGKLYPSSIDASAKSGSSGQTGIVLVTANESLVLSNAGQITLKNDASVIDSKALNPTVLQVIAPHISMKDATITAQSTGSIPASNITVTTDKLLLNTSRITTSANEGNGGAITVNGSGVLLNNSQITTSVTGTHGDGGNIAVHAATLALNTGFIQANTAANSAKGGDVTIDVKALAPSAGNSLFLGGSTPYTFKSGQFGYNVIQAAAPTGLNGEIHTTALAIDISGALAGLGAPALDAGGMRRNPCRIGGGSSFAKSGRGGFAPSARRSLVPLLAVPGGTASALPAALDQQLVSAPLDCGKS